MELKNTNHRTSNDDEILTTIQSKQEKFQRRLTRLKDGTSSMFKDFENDYDMLTDRIHRLETDVNTMKTPTKSTYTARKLQYSKSSESDNSSFSPFPQKHKSNDHVSKTPT